jgi:hypothetical protein
MVEGWGLGAWHSPPLPMMVPPTQFGSTTLFIPTQVSILLFRTILTGAVTGRTGVWAGLGLLGKALQLLVCSTLIGLAVSLAISRFLKVNTGICQHPTRQTIIIMLGSYVR